MHNFPFHAITSTDYHTDIIRAPNNDLLYFWTGDYYIYQSRSTNNGLTWSDSVKITNYYNVQVSLSALTSSSGRIIVFYLGNFFIYSDDNGITWNHFLSPPDSYIYDIAGGCLSQSSTGKLFYVFSKIYADTLIKDIFYITSTDNGAHWTSARLFAAGPVYGSITPISDNKLMMVYQNQGLFYSLSSDDGNTWGLPVAIDSNNISVNTPKIIKDPSGKLWLFYQKYLPTAFQGISQQDIVYRTSDDNGTTWNTENNFTRFKGDDGNYNISLSGNNPLVSFASNRGDSLNSNYWYGTAGVTRDNNAPPYLYKSTISNDISSGHQQYVVNAYVDCFNNISSAALQWKINEITQTPITMYDDGTHGDSISNDKIYTCFVPGINTGDVLLTSITLTDQFLNSGTYIGARTSKQISTAYDSAFIDVNRFKLPINNIGILGDQLFAGQTLPGGKYDDNIVLFSAGFFMSGISNGFQWANGDLSAARVEDYLPGKVGAIPEDPKNIVYVVRTSDPQFGQTWQDWKYAVSQGADFYDGDHDGVYNPVDKNGNGKWDPDEDRPDLLGNITAWCVYNDGLPAFKRTFQDVNPQGIEIQQTVFAQKDSADLNNVIFVRYRLINRGTVADILDSVYFGTAADIDIGNNGSNDLVGCDTLLNSGYIFHKLGAGDLKFGTNPPAEFITQLQGPLSYIPGITFTDVNANGKYDPGIDTPIDTAYNLRGPLLGKEIYPGAKNLPVTSSFQFYGGIEPGNRYQANYYLNGKDFTGQFINPCNWAQGQVFGGYDCKNINPAFMYSGDPVTQTGWLNSIPKDQKILVSSGPFKLVKNVPIELIIGHLVGRGSDYLNSITVGKGYAANTIKYYASNFPNSIITGVRELPNSVTNYRLDQNYPNPFNPSTKIRFSVNTNSWVTIKIINILGKEIAVIVNEQKHPGEYTIDFNAGKYNLASGVYFYKITAGSFTSVKKMMLLK